MKDIPFAFYIHDTSVPADIRTKEKVDGTGFTFLYTGNAAPAVFRIFHHGFFVFHVTDAELTVAERKLDGIWGMTQRRSLAAKP